MDIIENLVQAVSILNKTEEYLESLPNRLSECDSIISDYEHFIENNDISNVDSRVLFQKMKETFEQRRIIKKNITLRDNYKNMIARLNSNANREIFIQNMKNVKNKYETNIEYRNRVLTEEDIEEITTKVSKKRGRPRKQEVI